MSPQPVGLARTPGTRRRKPAWAVRESTEAVVPAVRHRRRAEGPHDEERRTMKNKEQPLANPRRGNPFGKVDLNRSGRAGPETRRQLLDGTCRPGPVRKKAIDNPDGGQRLLGIPDAVERLTGLPQKMHIRRGASSKPCNRYFAPRRDSRLRCRFSVS